MVRSLFEPTWSNSLSATFSSYITGPPHVITNASWICSWHLLNIRSQSITCMISCSLHSGPWSKCSICPHFADLYPSCLIYTVCPHLSMIPFLWHSNESRNARQRWPSVRDSLSGVGVLPSSLAASVWCVMSKVLICCQRGWPWCSSRHTQDSPLVSWADLAVTQPGLERYASNVRMHRFIRSLLKNRV